MLVIPLIVYIMIETADIIFKVKIIQTGELQLARLIHKISHHYIKIICKQQFKKVYL